MRRHFPGRLRPRLAVTRWRMRPLVPSPRWARLEQWGPTRREAFLSSTVGRSHAPARTPSSPHHMVARYACTLASHPDEVSRRISPAGPVVGLLAEELADLIFRVEHDSAASRGDLLPVGPDAVGDDARELIEGDKLHPRRSSGCARAKSAAGHWRRCSRLKVTFAMRTRV